MIEVLKVSIETAD
jgi:hypothetical protein